MTTVGIIGGTGLYALEGLSGVREIKVDTPFGQPSDLLVTGKLDGVELVFVPRHGRGHRFTPTEVPYRANIFALKSLGVDTLISVSAVGSMKEHLHPGCVVLPSQYIDVTRSRTQTFFEEGIVAHVSMADPVCPHLTDLLARSGTALELELHRGGTYVCIEGPAFSSRAESTVYRSWGVDVIGMTAMPEAKLAREAELHYATLALVTDFDCWHTSEEAVTVEGVMATLRRNTDNVKALLSRAMRDLASFDSVRTVTPCGCGSSLAGALTTDRTVIPGHRLEELAPLVKKYVRS